MGEANRNLLEELAGRSPPWLVSDGPQAALVISSRARLARNLEGIPFAHQGQDTDLRQVMGHIEEACRGAKSLQNSTLVHMDEVDEIDRAFLVERHLISMNLATGGVHSGVFIREDEIVSLMVNEEDHLRLQAIRPGFQLQAAWQQVDQIDDHLAASLDLAFSEEFGYLTACPTNTGSGLRLSVLIHLPGLVITKNIEPVLRAIGQVGLTVRGMYGEGTQPAGHLVQISNQTTLGRSEEALLELIKRATEQIIGYERQAREALLEQAPNEIKDKVWRAYATLCYAHLLTSQEALELISAVRLGVEMEILPGISMQTLNWLTMMIQPAHIQKIHGAMLNSEERDVVRGRMVRDLLRT